MLGTVPTVFGVKANGRVGTGSIGFTGVVSDGLQIESSFGVSITCAKKIMENYLKMEKEQDTNQLVELQQKIQLMKQRLQKQEEQISETRQMLKENNTKELDEHIRKLHIIAEQQQQHQEIVEDEK